MVEIAFTYPRNPSLAARMIGKFQSNPKHSQVWSHVVYKTDSKLGSHTQCAESTFYGGVKTTSWERHLAHHKHRTYLCPFEFNWDLFYSQYSGIIYGYSDIAGMAWRHVSGAKNPFNDGLFCSDFIVSYAQDIAPGWLNLKGNDTNLMDLENRLIEVGSIVVLESL